MSNLPTLRTGDAIATLTSFFTKLPPVNLPSVMLWGAPGIGKSDACKEAAEATGEILHKKVVITDVRLLLFQAIDLRGIPVADVNKEFAIWLRPKVFDMDASDNVINFLVLDEISAAPPSVQAAAYQLTLDRKVGEHKLPDNCIIIAAGNRVTDKSVAYKMPKALANRLLHLELSCDREDWKKWAIPHGIDERIISYLNYKASDEFLFGFNASNDDLAFATPRSWTKVSDIIKGTSDLSTIFPLIAGLIGAGTATDFEAYSRLFTQLPDVDAIFKGNFKGKVPKQPDILYAMSGAIVARCADRSQNEINNMMSFMTKIPGEMAFLTVKDALNVKDKDGRNTIRVKIVTSPEWDANFRSKWNATLNFD